MTAPYIDPKLVKHRTLFDSLLAASGVAPDSILLRHPRQAHTHPDSVFTGLYTPATRTLEISPLLPDARRTAIHEFGHVSQFEHQPEFLEWARKLGTPVERETPEAELRGILEGHADAFADAFDALARRDTASIRRNPGISLLAQMLAQRPP